ncbi:hypothetical protein JW756_04220 [Candidatus Woesearchaeota archaeon]|nr:hypothetical protein [Candidatus Woesearchaeota archaeon]
MQGDEKERKIINLVVHYKCLEDELRMVFYRSKEVTEKIEAAVSEIEKIKNFENTILYEEKPENVMKELKLTPDCYVRLYGAYVGMCLSRVDEILTRHSIPHEMVEGGYI